MTASAIFGPIVTGADVEAAVIAHLKQWLPSYLAELERRTGRSPGVLPAPRSFDTVNTFALKPGDQLPACVVISPGLADTPHRRGDGVYNGWFRIGVAVCCSAATQADSNELSKLYAAAIRTLFVHKPSLDGFASGLELVAEGYDHTPPDYLAVGAVAEVDVDVEVAAISQASMGPAEPAPAPDPAPADAPDVSATQLTVTKEPIT